MRTQVVEPFKTARGIILAGQIIEISEHLFQRLKGKVKTFAAPPATGEELRVFAVGDDKSERGVLALPPLNTNKELFTPCFG